MSNPPRFEGVYRDRHVDPKNRIYLPAEFMRIVRETYANNLVYCLIDSTNTQRYNCYDSKKAEEILASLRDRPTFSDKKLSESLRTIGAVSEHGVVDSKGRLALPKHLSHSGLVTVIGAHDYFILESQQS